MGVAARVIIPAMLPTFPQVGRICDVTETQQRTTRPRRKLTADESQRWETELLSRLGVVGPLPTALRVRGLLVALVAGLLAFFTRF